MSKEGFKTTQCNLSLPAQVRQTTRKIVTKENIFLFNAIVRSLQEESIFSGISLKSLWQYVPTFIVKDNYWFLKIIGITIFN